MTLIESIYEIKSAVLDLQKYLCSKDKVVSKRAQIKYEQWIDRFFRENVNMDYSAENKNLILGKKQLLPAATLWMDIE
jgi:hypothetical protein